MLLTLRTGDYPLSFEVGGYFIQNVLCRIKNLVIFKSNDFEAIFGNIFSPLMVIFFCLRSIMNCAIQFNYKLFLSTIEVNSKRTNTMLPVKSPPS